MLNSWFSETKVEILATFLGGLNFCNFHRVITMRSPTRFLHPITSFSSCSPPPPSPTWRPSPKCVLRRTQPSVSWYEIWTRVFSRISREACYKISTFQNRSSNILQFFMRSMQTCSAEVNGVPSDVDNTSQTQTTTLSNELTILCSSGTQRLNGRLEKTA